MTDKVQDCGCGAIEGKTTILNSQAHVGITTEFRDNGVFINNKALYLWNNYCPECGTKYENRARSGEQEAMF